MLFKKYSLDKIDYYLILLLTLLSVSTFKSFGGTNIWFLQQDRIHESEGFFSLIEFIQLVLLILNIFLILKNRKILIKQSNNLIIFAIRLFIPFLLIFEETSFFLKDFFKGFILTEINNQGEFNFHNSPIMGTLLLNKNIFGENFLTENVTLEIVLYFLIFIILSFGPFIPFLKKFSFIFFEKRFLIFGLIYILNIISFQFLRFLGILKLHPLISNEFIELFYYQLLLFDLNQKIIKSKFFVIKNN